MLATQLKLMKEKRGLTNQQLADLSGVPVGTVNRILSGQTDNPSFQTICDLVLAMDGSLDELAGIEKAPEGPEAALAAQLGKRLTKQRIIGTIELLQTYRGACAYNVGASHVLGALAVELEEIL